MISEAISRKLGKTRAGARTAIGILVLALTLASLPANATNGSASCSRSNLNALEEPAEGDAKLCIREHSLRATIRAKNLSPGHAYTVWWVYFDDPSHCAVPYECGLIDFSGANPQGVFGRMDSAISPRRGAIRFNGNWRGMQPSNGAQIWFLIFGHGPVDYADGRHLARQLLTPEDPNAGAPHLGNFIDGSLGFPAAVAVFDVQ